jgi:4-amino-4-deoxy-L-arabinose transferase-like glycosyltransferase
VYLSFLGLPLIGGSSEAREAQVVDVILRDGTWALPLRNGIVPSKPILFHWVGACLSLLIGGVSEFSVRLTSLLFGLGIIAIAALVSFCLARLNRAWECSFVPQHVALIAAGILCLTYGFHVMVGQAMVDMCFAFFVWCALLALLSSNPSAWIERRGVSVGARALFWTACSGAVLARGPLGIILPLALVSGPVLALCGPRVVIREVLKPSVGWLAFAAPVAWYYTAYSHGGEAFLERQLLFENVRRFFGGEHVNTQPWWFYGPSLLRSTLPWGIMVLVCWIAEMRRPRLDAAYGGRSKMLFSAPLIALTVGVALFSCSAGKRHSYLVPLYPLLAVQFALVAGTWMERGGSRFRQRVGALSRRLEWVLALLGIAVVILLGDAVRLFLTDHPLRFELLSALALATPRLGVLILVTVVTIIAWTKKSLRSSLFCVWLAVVVLMTGLISTGASIKAHLKNFQGMSAQLLAQARPMDELTVIKGPFDEYFDPILWYVHRRVHVFRDDLDEAPCAEQRLYLARRQWLDKEPERLQGRVTELGVLRERGSAIKEDSERELVFFRCQPNSATGRLVYDPLPRGDIAG